MRSTSTSVPKPQSLLSTRLRAFGFALAGLREAIRREQPIRLHLIGLCAVILVGAVLPASPLEWLLLLGSALGLIASELLNTALERLCDLVTKNWNAEVRYIKDLSAGAVLIALLGCACIFVWVIARHV